MHCAVFLRREEATRLLLDRGAELDIFTAAGLGQVDYMETLVDASPQCVDARDITARTPLHWAAHLNRKNAVEYLLARGARTDLKAHDGATPLQLAVQGDAREVVQLLQAGEK